MNINDVSWASSIIDDLKKAHKRKHFKIMDESSYQELINELRYSQKFKLPEDAALFSKRPDKYLLEGMHLPYPVCLLEFLLYKSKIKIAVMVTEVAKQSESFQASIARCAPNMRFGINLFFGMGGNWILCPYQYGIQQNSDGVIVGMESDLRKVIINTPEEVNALARTLASIATNATLDFMSLMMCKNIEIEEMAALPKKQQQTRIAMGREPYHSFHLLRIKMSHGPSQPLDENHIPGTPRRFHWVRGHIRHYATGYQTYIQPHTRGNAALGTIEKVYQV